MALLRHPATGDFGRAERLCARRERAELVEQRPLEQARVDDVEQR